jgi:DHA3 family macrolide efflux protein-like MFS transporter
LTKEPDLEEAEETEEVQEVPGSRLTGMPGFTVVWFGQLISFVGTGMTQFGLTIWAWLETGDVMALAAVAFFAFVPTVLLMPFAGVLVDRWNRKWVMALTDLTAGIASIGILVLFMADALVLWHVFILVMFAGAFQAFQFPAFSAATTMMVAKRHYGRASGMMSLAQSFSMILSPILAALVLGWFDLSAVLVVDILTFLVALGCLALVPIPQPPRSEEGEKAADTVLKEAAFGFRYIYRNKGLLGLQLILFAFNFIGTFAIVLLAPMILAKTGDDVTLLGTVMGIGSIGGVVGGVIMSVWGGPKMKVHGVLLGLAIAAVGGIVLGLGRTSFHWAAGIFIFMSTFAITNGCNQAIWQSKVAPDLQGRVFATRALIATISVPVAQPIAGLLSDYAAEPLMREATGPLADLFGSGAGAGMAMIIFIVGVIGVVIGLAGYRFRNVRDVESLMPDHDVAKASEEDGRVEEGQEGDKKLLI